MEPYEPYVSLGLATAAGLLIGVEREKSAGDQPSLGGARTHPLLALAGGVAMLVSRETGWPVVTVAFAGLILFLVVNFAEEARRGANHGLTSEAAFLVSFLLGVLAATRDVLQPLSTKVFVVSAASVVATLLLAAKPTLHPVVRKLSNEDVAATLKFLIVAVVILPLLPDHPYGPLGALNPRQIGVLVALTSGMSFLGYAAVRVLGARRGLGLTGLVGGFASSTAVTLSMSGRARKEPKLVDSLALAVVLSSSVMFVRMAVLVAVAGGSLIRIAWLPLGAMAAAGLLVSIAPWRRSERSAAGGVMLSNPFELSQALKFAVIFSIVLVGSKAATTYLGASGAIAAGAIAGLADVDAITLSMSRLAHGGEVPMHVAYVSIFAAGATNTVVKAAIAATLGGWAYARIVVRAFAVILAAGAVAALVFVR